MRILVAIAAAVLSLPPLVPYAGEANAVQHVDQIPAQVCGPANATVAFVRTGSNPGYIEAQVTVSKGSLSTVVRVSGARDYLGLRCEASSKDEPHLVIQAYCGGSGCHDLDNFYIVSAETLKLLLAPRTRDDMNRQEAASILGHAVLPMTTLYSIPLGKDGRER